MTTGPIIPSGILFPESILNSDTFAVLAVFVAINTLMYVTLAVGKILPKIYFSDFKRRPRLRSETRSIHPD